MEQKSEMTSLRDINLKLRDGNHKEPDEDLDVINQRFNDAAFQERKEQERAQYHKRFTWIKDEKGDFFTYVSDLNAKAQKGYPRNQCPRCRGLFYEKDLQKNILALYLYRCPDCGVMLTIYKR
jgi:predicted restriction endonuclease